MKEEWFVTSLCGFTDILAELALLSKRFQRDSVSNREMKGAVDALKLSIEMQYLHVDIMSLKFGGRKLAALLENRSKCKNGTFQFKGVEIEISGNCFADTMQGIKEFATQVHINLEERLDVFDLHFILDDSEYGWSDMEVILNHYGVDRLVKGKIFPVLVDVELCKVEWPILRAKMVIESKKSGITNIEFWREHLTMQESLTPTLDKLVVSG